MEHIPIFEYLVQLQSLNNTNPKIYSSASSIGIGSPKSLASVVIKAISNSKSTNLLGPKTGSVAPCW